MLKNEIINIVICYNNYIEVIEYHEKILHSLDGNKVGYVVVINGEKEENIKKLEQYCDKNGVYLYNPKENLGYMNGLLYGYRSYRKENEIIPRYVIMSNTDISFGSNDFFRKLNERKYENDVWSIGPSVLVRDLNSYDNPVAIQRYTKKQIQSFIRKFKTPIIREIYVSLAFLKPRIVKKKKVLNSQNVYEVHGCFFILKGEYAERIRNMHYGPFLYSEETFIAENAYKNKKITFYDSELEIIHLEHATTSKLKPTKRAKYLRESMEWIRDEYYK